MKYNWKPVIKSALKHLTDTGMRLDSVDNGDGREKATDTKTAVDLIEATDESHVYLRHPENQQLYLVYLVLGNDPEELFADWAEDGRIDKAQEAFEKQWAGKSCPTE